MTVFEKFVYGCGLPVGFGLLRCFPRRLRGRLIVGLRLLLGQHAISDEAPADVSFSNLLEVFESMKSKQLGV